MQKPSYLVVIQGCGCIEALVESLGLGLEEIQETENCGRFRDYGWVWK